MCFHKFNLYRYTKVVYSQRQENTIPKLIANKLTTLNMGEWILPFWRQRSTHVCASQRTAFNSAGVMRSADEIGLYKLNPVDT
jgi:hypothetical protein